MSAESPNSSANLQRPTGSSVIVTPQEVTDPTILESVAGFINDVVPATNSEPFDVRDQIQWVRFEHLDSGEVPFFDCQTDETILSPLILVLGYTTGIQIWAILANGEAIEILSWRHGSVKALRILPNPFSVDKVNNDAFASKRPLIALCDNCSLTPNSSPTGALSFVSLKTSEQVKLIKFKKPILDVFANKQSIVVTFCEKIAIFDAFTLDDRLTVTTCYLSPGIQPNPVALGARWLAYAENKLHSSKRSSGGCDGDGVQSYTATVLHAAKSLGRGLKELGETVASSLTGNPQFKPGLFPSSSQISGQSDGPQKGIVTVLDIASQSVDTLDKNSPSGAVIAHFAAHNDAIVCLSFDSSGALLLTADKRGHDFHLFRIHPHPNGSAQAAVHHLYTLHRGDTSAKVQDMCFSPDSRWVAISTLRGTTHLFAVTPYGGSVCVRTHTTPYVVNKMSRFHRSAGLTSEGRSNSPVSVMETPVNSIFPFYNPRYPPFPHPVVFSHALRQLRQPLYIPTTNTATSRTGVRQRASSSSEENIALRLVACFAPPRAWLDSAPNIGEKVKPADSLFVMSCYGLLLQYDLEPQPASTVPKDRVCDDTILELKVSPKAQWMLQRRIDCDDVPLPMSSQHLALIVTEFAPQKDKSDRQDEEWLSQVEIVTHAGPHRRLWMGPQFEFKTYTVNNGSLSDPRPIDVRRSKPVNMPVTKTNAVLIESSSAGSADMALLDTYHKSVDDIAGLGELQLREDLADAMQECTGRESGGHIILMSKQQAPVAKVVNPLGTVVTIHSDDEQEIEVAEDSVCHENCDEALFRPVVAARPVQHTDNKYTYHRSEDIIVHSLHSTSEVAVQLPDNKDKAVRREKLNTMSEPSCKTVKPKAPKQNDINKFTKNKSNFNEIKSASLDSKNNKTKSNHHINNTMSSNLTEYVQSVTLDEGTTTSKTVQCNNELLTELHDKKTMTKSKNKQKNDYIEKTRVECIKQNVEIIPSSSEISDKYLVLDELDASFDESELKSSKDNSGEVTEVTRYYENTFPYNFEIKGENAEEHFSSKYQGLEASEVYTEDCISVEKNMSKKPRKPKAKLGVRIPVTETGTKVSKSNESLSNSQTSFSRKMSYSAMAAAKPFDKEKSPVSSDDNINDELKEDTRTTSYTYSTSKPPDNQQATERVHDDLDIDPIEDTKPVKPKLSYNAVAASRQMHEKSPIIIVEDENQLDLALDDVDNFTVKLPKKYHNDLSNMEEKLIDFDSPSDIISTLEDSFECQSDSKKDSIKDKSSDDEKVDSPVETTESDDLLTEEQTNNAEKSTSSQISKSAKRKARKKKK